MCGVEIAGAACACCLLRPLPHHHHRPIHTYAGAGGGQTLTHTVPSGKYQIATHSHRPTCHLSHHKPCHVRPRRACYAGPPVPQAAQRILRGHPRAVRGGGALRRHRRGGARGKSHRVWPRARHAQRGCVSPLSMCARARVRVRKCGAHVLCPCAGRRGPRRGWRAGHASCCESQG